MENLRERPQDPPEHGSMFDNPEEPRTPAKAYEVERRRRVQRAWNYRRKLRLWDKEAGHVVIHVTSDLGFHRSTLSQHLTRLFKGEKSVRSH